MTSNIKEYELVEQTQNRSETDVIPEGVSVQGQYLQHVRHPHQMQPYPHHQPHQMMHPSFIQQPMYMNGMSQFIPTDPLQMNPMQLTAKHEEYEQEIRKYKHLVTVNWIMSAIHVVFGLFLIVFLVLIATNIPYICGPPPPDRQGHYDNSSMPYHPPYSHRGQPDQPPKNDFEVQNCVDFMSQFGTWLIAIGILFITVSVSFLVFMNYRGRVAYRMRSAESMECMLICYGFIFVLSAIGVNCIGMAGYGYLAYAAHNLKTIFAEIRKLERVMASQGMNTHSLHYIAQPNM